MWIQPLASGLGLVDWLVADHDPHRESIVVHNMLHYASSGTILCADGPGAEASNVPAALWDKIPLELLAYCAQMFGPMHWECTCHEELIGSGVAAASNGGCRSRLYSTV